MSIHKSAKMAGKPKSSPSHVKGSRKSPCPGISTVEDPVLEAEFKAVKLKQKRDEDTRTSSDPRKFIPAILTDLEDAIELQTRIKSTSEDLNDAEQTREDAREQFRIECMRRLQLAELVLPSEAEGIEKYQLPAGSVFDVTRKAVLMLKWVKIDENRKWALDLIRNFTWPVLLICLHSDIFLDTFLHAGMPKCYDERYAAVVEHRATLEFFARTRHFEPVRRTAAMTEYYLSLRDLTSMKRGKPLAKLRTLTDANWDHYKRHSDCSIIGLPADLTTIRHPHEWRLRVSQRASAKRLTFKIHRPSASHWERVFQDSIDTAFVSPDHTWTDQSTWTTPDEPRFHTEFDGPCAACGLPGTGTGSAWRADCACIMPDLKRTWAAKGKYTDCRVDLMNYGVMGTGVRALQDFKKASLLGEYVGEVLPNHASGNYGDSTYVYQDVRRLGPGRDKVQDSCIIDPIIHGNWTRYLNHSCDGHATFRGVAVGPRVLTLVVNTRRSIKFGEQIFINYGINYFGLATNCYCGTDECEFWGLLGGENPERVSLGTARETGLAPAWALEEPEVDTSDEVEMQEHVGRLERFEAVAGKRRREDTAEAEEYHSPREPKRRAGAEEEGPLDLSSSELSEPLSLK